MDFLVPPECFLTAHVGSVYIFTLSLTNWLGQSAVDEHIVTRVTNPINSILIDGPQVQELPSNIRVDISILVERSKCNDETVDDWIFEWNSVPILNFYLNQNFLKIRPNNLYLRLNNLFSSRLIG